MSIKKLFDSTNSSRNYLSTTTEKDSFKNVESSKNIQELTEKQKTYIPQIDYSKPERFVRYGSAYLYYKGAMERIYNYYPYDGSDAEITSFYNDLLGVEKFIFDNEYPRTNGQALLSADGWGSLNGSIDNGYGTPSDLEYITFYGGPNTSSYTSLADAFPSDLNSKREASNVYDTDIYTTDGLPSDYATGTRQSNLRSNFDTGVTIEFWLKKAAFDNTKTEKEVVFDMWNNGVSGSNTYGRLRVELTGASSGSPFLITAQSASSGILQQSIGQNLTTASLETYSHYAVTFYNSGTNLITELYVNGTLNDTNTTAGALSELNSKNMTGRIGALLTASVDGGSVYGAAGAGKLSASLDEFRFWKEKRTIEDIGLNWKSQVRGGVNTDVSNATLGIYYKFNEGITEDSSIDNVVLDYSGRISNGVWVGYDSYSRLTSSAFVEAGVRTSEYLDPIIYSTHPSVSSLQTTLLSKGQHHDYDNNSSFLNTLPSWIVDETDEETDDIRLLSHIVGAYLDKLYLQIESVSQLKFQNYTSASAKPVPFAEHLPQSLGLYTPDLFIDSTVLEKFLNRDETTFMESDLNDVKNLIYLNLYGSLAGLFKSKGTERAVRNILRCFNLDDRVVKLNTYSDRNFYILKNNLQNTVKSVSFVNFNTSSNVDGVVYQAADASNAESFAFISGTYEDNKEDRYGFTVEADLTFPHFERNNTNVVRTFTDVSLFGLTLANTSSASDTTWAASDPVNFQVYAIRPEEYSKHAYFKLTSSVSPNPFPELTSSLFFDVYDNNQWNFSVRLKPSNYPVTDIVSGSDTFTYDLEFRGINAINDTIQNSFLLTSSVSQAVGSEILKSAKRVYVGARRTNITGAVQTKTDVLFNDVKYWTKYLFPNDINQHLYDPENSGISGSYRNVSALDTNINTTDVKNLNSLALHWTFENITGSDSSGNFFYVNDMSSGSAEIRNNYGWIGGISGYQYNGYGYGFEASSNNVVKGKFTNTIKFTDPEQTTGINMMNSLGDTDLLYRPTQIPPDFFHTIEKSMYGAISEEMLLFFAGVVDFNNLIGNPVNRYRERYKDLEKLREIFFRKVSKTSTVEKFLNYYKWLDDSIAAVIDQFIPGSANIEADIYNVIESHVLERNKYKSQFPTLTEYPSTEGVAQGFEQANYNWKFGHAPVGGSQSDNTIWWSKRSNRSDTPSGDTTVDEQRETFREAGDLNDLVPQPDIVEKSFTVTRASKQGALGQMTDSNSLFVKRVSSLSRLNNVDVFNQETIKGGTNFSVGKDLTFTYNATYPAGPVNTAGAIFVPENVLLAFIEDMSDIVPTSNDVLDPNKKIKRNLKVLFGREYIDGLGYFSLKSSRAFPFNVISSSVVSGYNAAVVDGTSASVEITNLHNDVYGPDMEKPLQSPFTEYAVGGHQSRHVALNKGSDGATSRPEAWKIVLGFSNSSGTDGAIGLVGADYPVDDNNYYGYSTEYPRKDFEKAVYYRDLVAKRPVNIRNILMRTGSTILGNYEHNYQVIHSVGGNANPRAFVDNPPTLPTQIAQTPSASQARSILDTRRTDESHFEFVPDYAVNYLHDNTNNKSVIRSKFSAPGGIETLGQGYGSIRANEYSVYNSLNYRNLSVRRPFQSMGSTSETVGVGTTGIRVSDQNDRDYGLVRNLQSHAERFGRDELVSNPGESYEQDPAFHKVNRNPLKQIIQDSDGNFLTGTMYDNFYIQHAIPRSDKQYAWITGSLTQDALGGTLRYDGYSNVDGLYAGLYDNGYGVVPRYVAFFDFLTASQIQVASYLQTGEINTYVDEPVDDNDDNVLGLSTDLNILGYYNTDLVPGLLAGINQDSDYLNLLNVKRRNYLGFRGAPNASSVASPVIRKHNKNNVLTITNNKKLNTISRYTYKPVTNRNEPVLLNITTVPIGQSVTIKTPYDNQRLYFSDDDLNEQLEKLNVNNVTVFNQLVDMTRQSSLYNLNWVLYSEALFPKKTKEFTANSSTRVGYDNKFWRDTQSDRLELHTDSIVTNSYGVIVSQSSWPLDAPSDFTTRTSSDLPVIASSDTNHLAFSNSAGESQNTYLHVHTSLTAIPSNIQSRNCKVGGLYSRKHLLGGTRTTSSPFGIETDEVGSYSRIPTTADYTASISDSVDLYAGEAFWDAASQAGIVIKSGSSFSFQSQSSKPWYNNYDSYNDDLKSIFKGYAIVPEFRLSEQVSDYVKLGINSIKNDTFEIPGTDNDSSQEDFYIDFSNTEFMENFVQVKNLTGLGAKEIKLVCNASIKFNPYKGFYPVQRTNQLIEQFKDTYGNAISGESDGISVSSGAKSGLIRPLAQSLFAPGILYNTIKAGMAVDYPIAAAPKFKKTFFGASVSSSADAAWMLTTNSTSSVDGYIGGEFFDRVPFEAIIRPSKHILNKQFYDNEPHPSASLSSTSSMTDTSNDNLYDNMASNFFAEIGNFFMKDSQFTRLESETIRKTSFGENEVYGLRLKIRRSLSGSRNYASETGSAGNNLGFSSSGAKYFDSSTYTFLTGAGYSLPQNPRQLSKDTLQENFTMYSRPTAFGPPVSGRQEGTGSYANNAVLAAADSLNGCNPAFTPCYYDGESWCDFIFRPSAGVEYDLKRVLSELKTVFWRFDAGPTSSLSPTGSSTGYTGTQFILTPSGNITGVPDLPYDGKNINANSMQISSSINILGIEDVNRSTSDSFGNLSSFENETAGSKWVIQLKSETPHLNFNPHSVKPVEYTNPSYSTSSVPRGMWHQFGIIEPDSAKGVFMEITDIPQYWLRYHYKAVSENSEYNDNNVAASGSNLHLKMKSLTDVVPFKENSVKIGELNNFKEIKEAIVAVPYINSVASGSLKQISYNKKEFFGIDRFVIDACLTPNSKNGDSLDFAGESIRDMVSKVQEYILPPQFDFLNNSEIEPMAMYIFEFKHTFDKDDLSYIWQNLAPRNYKQASKKESALSHVLSDNELLSEDDLMSEDLRWMIFKVKQRSQKLYGDMVTKQVGVSKKTDNQQANNSTAFTKYNWPYDYVSFVEGIKFSAKTLYKQEE